MPAFKFWHFLSLLQRHEDSLVKVREVGGAETSGIVPSGRGRVVLIITTRDIKVDIPTVLSVRDGVI
jgi:hypothetical protein